jgi:hypothetical protein
MEMASEITAGPVGFVEKLRVAIGCAAAVLVMWALGWRMVEPVDPDMGVLLAIGGRSVWAVWPGLAVLAVVVAIVGTVISGKKISTGGPLAAAVGLAVMSLRGGSMQVVLAYHADGTAATRRALMGVLIIDCVLWTGVMAAAWVASMLARNWLWPEAAVVEPAPAPKPGKGAKAAAAAAASKSRAGWAATVIVVVVAVLFIWMTDARTQVATILRDQVIASVLAGLYLGALAARYFTGTTEPAWYVLGVPVVGLIAYILGYISADMSWAQGTAFQPYASLATTPPHDLARALPVEYIAVGVAGAIMGLWTGERLEHAAEQQA